MAVVPSWWWYLRACPEEGSKRCSFGGGLRRPHRRRWGGLNSHEVEMTAAPPDFRTDSLGECTIVSPLRATQFMDKSKPLLFRADIDELREQFRAGVDPPAFELAGPRKKIYFDPITLRCGIVTCGGVCARVNYVHRSDGLSFTRKEGHV